ncbi:MAG: sulfite exporter TauE/SafE family protein, partial [Victivallaceae bacterium]|nr:sulfite exporter TauE/SafE family protein [Victivallaceae bacterium]
MSEYILAIATAAWLGFLCSISPCPLATNIAAISFVGRKVGKVGAVLGAGLLYTLGRTLTYVALGIIMVGGLTAAPELSHMLQKYMNLLMGPLLILVAMVLLYLIKF